MRKPTMIILAGAFIMSVTMAPGEVAGQIGYRRPPEPIRKILDLPPTPGISISPTGEYLLLVDYDRYPPVKELAEPMLRLAGLRIDPKTDGPHRKPRYHTFTLQHVETGKQVVLDRRDGARLGSPIWSPDGNRLAFTDTTESGIDLWVADVPTGKAWLVAAGMVNDTVADPFDWMPDGKTLLVARRVLNDDAEPPPPEPEFGPIIQESSGQSGPVRTYQDLLENKREEALFDQHCSAQMVVIDPDPETHTAQEIGQSGIYTQFDPSPDGRFFLVERVKKPYSYLHTYRSFPMDVEVWDRDGNKVATIADVPLADNIPIGGVRTGPRSYRWMPTESATLVWSEALDDGDPDKEAEFRDKLMTLTAPFEGEPVEWLKLEQRYAGLRFGESGELALVTDYDRDRKWIRTFRVNPRNLRAEPELIFDRSVQDRYGDPGDPVYKTLRDGGRVMRQIGDVIFLSGAGSSPTGDRPFLDRFDLKTKQTERLFHSGEGIYEGVATVLDEQGERLIIRRESETVPPNFFLREKGQPERALTEFTDPAPELRKITKKRVLYMRKDGVDLSFVMYLPPDYQEGQKLPAVVWAYPREYASGDTAGQVSGSTDRFTLLGGYSHLFFLLQGYVVLDEVAMPIVGPPKTANDTFREQLVMNAEAAIDAADALGVIDRNRIGVGGHSYGAFMAANMLAHSDLFKAGIARSGAYNRTLTPFGFQNERRTFWEAPEIYATMSPFHHADKINEPLLLIHGQADNNPGTFPIQSERLYHAVRGNGGIVRYVLLPHESHGYSGRESIEHILAEMIDWFNQHVKGDME